MTDKSPPLFENRLLALLPAVEQNRLVKHLEPIHFARKRILYEAGQPMRNAYFFQNGMASLFAVAEDGGTVPIAVVGTNGFVGVPIILMANKTPTRIVTQTPVEALKIDAHQLLVEFNRRGQLQEVLLRYSQVLQIQIAQTALCNSLHTIKQRLCRWLLLCKDSTESERFDFTQEDLANMLGSHRNQVSFVARYLAKRQLIQYSRGQIILLDQKKLEQETCDCYRTVRQWTDELL